MQKVPTARRRRAALRGLAKQLRREDPGLAELLSARDHVLPPLRLRSFSVRTYAVIALTLFVIGVLLGVLSAMWWGLVVGGLAIHRWQQDWPSPRSSPRRP